MKIVRGAFSFFLLFSFSLKLFPLCLSDASDKGEISHRSFPPLSSF